MDLLQSIAGDIATTTGRQGVCRMLGSVAGGCINRAIRVAYGDERYFIKLNHRDALDMFAAEAQGLLELRRVKALYVPEPVCWGREDESAWLVLEDLDLGADPDLGELRRDGLYAMGIASLLILAYIAFRFSTRFAPGAVLALVHDVSVTAGVFVIFGMEFDLRVLAALLAILGYSLNDTIIIYDRIRENMELRTKHDLVEVLNQSVNQTLARTILTSGTTMVAVMALLLVGGEVIRPFAIAMAIGIVVGTYSSIFIAAPTLLFLETRLKSGESSGKARK